MTEMSQRNKTSRRVVQADNWTGFGLEFVELFRACMQNFFATTDTFAATYC